MILKNEFVFYVEFSVKEKNVNFDIKNSAYEMKIFFVELEKNIQGFQNSSSGPVYDNFLL